MTLAIDGLRARYLAAMGIPLAAAAACGGASAQRSQGASAAPASTGGPPTAAVTTETTETTEAPAAPRVACGADEIRESVCGFTAAPACPAERGDMGAYVSLAPYGARGPLSFDAAMTSEWMTPLAGKERLHGASGRRLCCYSGCTALEVTPAPTAELPPATGPLVSFDCIPKPEAPSKSPSSADERCPAAVVLPAHAPGKTTAFMHASGHDALPSYPPSWQVEQCCYRSVARTATGRTLRIDGEARVAGTRSGSEWTTGAMPAPRRVAAARAAELAREWRDIAALEHASVAAFARLSLMLLSHGAPADLVERTHAAALDEIAHARIAYHLASAYGGEPIAPAPLDATGAVADSLEELAVETLLDGCIEETVGAEWARRAAEDEDDPVVASALRRIADDEAGHAELAFRIVAWAVSADPSLAPRLFEALASRSEPAGNVELRREIVTRVVEPCLLALVGRVVPPSRAST